MESEWMEAWAIVEPYFEEQPYLWHVLYKVVDTKIMVKGIYAPDKYASEWPGMYSRSGDMRETYDAGLNGLQALIKRRLEDG